MNDFDDEDDKDASVAPGRLAAAEEESFRREARSNPAVLYQRRVKKDCWELLGASFDFHVKTYEEQQEKGSLEYCTKAEDYVLPLTMNDFDEEEDYQP